MMLRGGLLGDYHIMRPGEDFPSDDIIRAPASPSDAGLWQEPEDGRHPGDVMKNPVRKVADQRSLFDSDEDLKAYLAQLQRVPMFDERGTSFADWQQQRRMSALREELARQDIAPKPFQPGDVQALSALMPQTSSPATPRAPAGFASPTVQGQGVFGSQMMTGPLSRNIEDQRAFNAWNVENWLRGPGLFQ